MSKPVILLVLVALAGIFTIIMYCFLKKSEPELGLMLSVTEIVGYLSGFIALCLWVTAFFITTTRILDCRTDIIRDILCY